MDNWPDGVAPEVAGEMLSYDDSVAYEEQIPTHPSNDPGRASLANRIGTTKVYLLSETSVARATKVEPSSLPSSENKVLNLPPPSTDDTQRPNALLLQGPPISHLPTARLFSYAKNFDVEPLALEWVDDTTCVLVFETRASARTAHRYLRKSVAEDADENGFLTAKPIPIALWPPEERINTSLGKGEGLKGTIMMRWALLDDVKKKGARQQSAFYKKHGSLAGKEVYGGEGPPAAKRRRGGSASRDGVQDLLRKEQLDDELDQFLREDDEPVTPPSPPSKMRSDYLINDGRTLLERTSSIRAHPEAERPSLADRLTAPLPRRGLLGRMHFEVEAEDLRSRTAPEKLEWGPGREPSPRGERGDRRRQRGDRRGNRTGGDRRGEHRGGDRPPRHQPKKMTEQELDDDIDEFLRQKD
ncbi:hypothetical protein DXG03_006560 [Asterophora parasitica]|uniref:Chromatin target of PRMT1 protein C-terminal domain-containing protein n=1 Tax=Asterophora parasitica TaxID=117018 RepID=A0A9P7GAP0_9AGAR|nr:hypothetical protein DXG03_006560 [Asterophora parasitica]